MQSGGLERIQRIKTTVNWGIRENKQVEIQFNLVDKKEFKGYKSVPTEG